MTDSYVATPTEGSGKFVDAEQFSIGSQIVYRQRAQESYPAIISTSYDRPADTTAYTAGDALSNSTSAPLALTFAAGRFNGAGGDIVAAHMVDSANQATKLACELWLFQGSAAPVADNDNAAFTPTDAELAALVGVIQFTAANAFVGDATAGAGGNAITVGGHLTSPNFRLPFRCDPSLSSIFGLVVVRNAFTPVSAEKFTFRLHIRQE
jgi:hypothetical protein